VTTPELFPIPETNIAISKHDTPEITFFEEVRDAENRPFWIECNMHYDFIALHLFKALKRERNAPHDNA